MARCKGPRCGAEITWVKMASGGRMPLDPAPDPEGLILVLDGHGMKLEAPVADRAQLQPGEETYTSHYATCPDGESFRRRP